MAAIAVERIDAKDIFSARSKLREGATAMPPGALDKADSSKANDF